MFDKIFGFIANLIENVLENDEKESLMIKQIFVYEHHDCLVCKIKYDFEHREHFDKIKFDDLNDFDIIEVWIFELYLSLVLHINL